MPNKEWEGLKEALRKAPTPEAMKEAAQRFREYEEAKKREGRPSSKPTLVSLGLRKTYPHAIELKDIPDEIERNPAFFEFLKKVIK